MKQLSILILATEDVALERKELLQIMPDLNKYYEGKVEILASLDISAKADLTLAIVWTEANPSLASKQGSSGKILLRKTDAVKLDLAKRNEVLKRLEQKELLDTQLASLDGNWRRLEFGDNNPFRGVVENQLKRFIDHYLGISSERLSLRPQLGNIYVKRNRLLEQFPDDIGHVVYLEAPYGYGKSVLAAQWAADLEKEGWRIIWLAQVANQAIGPLLASALGLAADSPAKLLRERLWEEASLLVLEDLEEGVELDFLLEELNGLLLLASRKPLESDQLKKRLSSGQASHFDASDLAFTLTETEVLTGDKTLAASLHSSSLGWSLPLHIAALTGSQPDASSLLAGIQASLNARAWQELLFLAALPYLPESAQNESTEALIQKGFVQRLESSVRLHPFIADIAFERFEHDIAQRLRQEAARLPLVLQGEAYAKTQDFENLVRILEASEAELWKTAPLKLVQWDTQIKGLASPHRDWVIGAAQGRLGNVEAAVKRLELALTSQDLRDADKLNIMRHLCMPLGMLDNARGNDLIAQAETLLDHVDADLAGLFLGNAALIHAYAGNYQAAIETAERALSYYPLDSQFRLGSEINLALFRWHLKGDFDFRLQTQRSTLERSEALYPVQALGQCRDLAMFYWWLGDLEQTRYFLNRANQESINPAIATEVRAALAFLDNDTNLLSELSKTARAFSNPYVSDMVSSYKILQELTLNKLELALYSFEASSKAAFSSSAYAQVLAAQGKTEEALTLLAGFDEHEDRAERLYLDASRFLITSDETYLQAFLAHTTAATRLLPGFIPITSLPKRPELADHYPIAQVLASHWTEAIERRHAEIPDLELRLFGEVSVFLLDTPLELADRQKQIMALLGLGLSRDEIAEALWPDVDTKKQRNNLNVQLNLLRKAIEPWGLTTYLFESGLERVNSDYQALRDALDQGNREKVYQLYKEPLAPGIDLLPAIELRESLREEVVELFANSESESLADAPYLTRVLELEPLHEESLQQLLKLLIRRGRKREARQRYQKFAEQLEQELGLEPLGETQALIS